MPIFVNARFLTQTLTGVQRYAYEMAKVLKELDSTIVFLAPKNIKQEDWAQELKPIIIGSTKGYFWEQVTLAFFMSKQKKSVLVNLCNLAPVFCSRNVVTIHDLAFEEPSPFMSTWTYSFYRLLTKSMLKRALHVFTVSDTMRKRVIASYAATKQKISVTYNGLAESMLHQNQKPEQKEKIILSVGSLHGRKNHQLMIDAFIASSLSRDFQLILVGTSSQMFKEAEVKFYGGSIQVVSNISEDALQQLYKKAMIYVSASKYEGFNLPVLEALHFKCRVLVQKMPLYDELYGDYVSQVNFYNKAESIEKLDNFSSIRLISDKEQEALFQKYNYRNSAEHMYKTVRKLST